MLATSPGSRSLGTSGSSSTSARVSEKFSSLSSYFQSVGNLYRVSINFSILPETFKSVLNFIRNLLMVFRNFPEGPKSFPDGPEILQSETFQNEWNVIQMVQKNSRVYIRGSPLTGLHFGFTVLKKI